MPVGREVLLVAHVPATAFPGIASHIRESLEQELACRVTQVLPGDVKAALIHGGRWDLMLVLHGSMVDHSMILQARARGIRAALWLTEDPYEIDLHIRDLDVYDHVFTNDSAALSVYQHPRVSHLPWCTNPRIYYPGPVPPSYESDVCLVGNGFPNRMAILNAVADVLDGLNVKLVGDWTRWGDLLSSRLKRFVLPAEYRPEKVAHFFSGARINLNIHRDPSPAAMPNNWANSKSVPARSPNNRTFDIAGCGGFQLVDGSRPDLAACYEPGEELDVFSGPEDLSAKILHYLNHSDERRRMGEAARNRTIREHTFRHRLERIFQVLLS